MKKITERGFTIVELLVVLVVVGTISLFIISGFRNYALREQYDMSVGAVKSALIDSRVKARSAELDQAHGVKLLSTSVVMFQGSTYSAGAATNKTIPITGATISYSLTGGASTVVFDKLTGLPNATGTITIVGTSYVATTTLQVNASGVIQ